MYIQQIINSREWNYHESFESKSILIRKGRIVRKNNHRQKINEFAYVKYLTSNIIELYQPNIPELKHWKQPICQLVTVQFSSLQLLSLVPLFVTPWTAASQASLPFTNSRRLLKLISIESVMTSNHLILCLPLLHPHSVFPSIASGGHSIGVSASASVFPMNIQDSFL